MGGRRWSDQDDQRLIELADQSWSGQEIADWMGRSLSSVYDRTAQLGKQLQGRSRQGETQAKPEDADEIRRRHKRGSKATETMILHSWQAIADDLGMHETSLRRLMRGDFPTSTRLTEAEKEMVRDRRKLFEEAKAQRQVDGVDALKREFSMSTDTLNKLVDATPTESVVTAFLTGRFR